MGRNSLKELNEMQAMTDEIMENLDSESVYELFPEKYFPKSDLYPIIGGIAQNCDWQNRDGKFVDFFNHKKIGGVDEVSFIYEYYLSCDSLRFIVTVARLEEPEVMGFHLEPLENENPMVLFPEKQLINR